MNWYRLSARDPRTSLDIYKLCDRLTDGQVCELGLFSVVVKCDDRVITILQLSIDHLVVHKYTSIAQVMGDMKYLNNLSQFGAN